MNNNYETAQLAKDTWAINESIVRCFLIEGSEKAVLLDCCIGKNAEVSQIAAGLTKKPIDLVFTHTDPDHTGGQDGFGTPLLHPCEYDYYYLRGNEGRKMRALWEGDILDLGGIRLETVLIPGHTPGSIALLDREGRRIFIGDTVSDAWIHMHGEGRDLRAFIESLKKLEHMAGDFDVIYPCHGSAELGSEWTGKVLAAAEMLLAEKLEGSEPPHGMPGKAYQYEGVTLLY